jgi:hypothetical protein
VLSHTAREKDMSTTALPLGTDAMYIAMRNAGISSAVPLRNVSWINRADDGTVVFSAWRRQMEQRAGTLVAVIDAREWRSENGIRERKRRDVVSGLTAADGQLIRVIVLDEKVPKSRQTSGARYDADALWLVEDTGDEFLLWRGKAPIDSGPPIPASPQAYGHLSPDRKEVISRRIERDSRVRTITLARASNRCEIVGCMLWAEFVSVDVHHIATLGSGGADHTDNTVALCPACHAKVHRGRADVRADIQREIEKLRAARIT